VVKRCLHLPRQGLLAITPTFLMQRYGMLAKLVKSQPIKRTVRDIDDDIVIATALAAKADAIATGDQQLPLRKNWALFRRDLARKAAGTVK